MYYTLGKLDKVSWLSSYKPEKPRFWGRYKRLSNATYADRLDSADIKSKYAGGGYKAQLAFFFENQAEFAINHWIGVVRITAPNGGYDQYIISEATGKERALEDMEANMMKLLIREGYDFTINHTTLFSTSIEKFVADKWDTWGHLDGFDLTHKRDLLQGVNDNKHTFVTTMERINNGG